MILKLTNESLVEYLLACWHLNEQTGLSNWHGHNDSPVSMEVLSLWSSELWVWSLISGIGSLIPDLGRLFLRVDYSNVTSLVPPPKHKLCALGIIQRKPIPNAYLRRLQNRVAQRTTTDPIQTYTNSNTQRSCGRLKHSLILDMLPQIIWLSLIVLKTIKAP